ncbi:MAG: MBL fold metallo-hydrolase [Candidatus Micrarchaeota archaeon]|nr:MBL fold metallo-hydrolase [Candidatus Micrarchaeota archaeon]
MANSTIFSGVKITLLGHASVHLEGDGVSVYIDPFIVPKGSKEADIILYTHGHFDHAVSAPAITTPKTVIVGHKVKLPVRSIQIGEREKIMGVEVEAVHAYNLNKPYHPKGEGAGFIVRFKGASIYVAGDTDFIPEMKDYKCDVAILPIGGKYTMDASQASDAAAAIMPKIAIPYHYNYLEDTKADPESFSAMVAQKTNGKVLVRILAPLQR